VEKEIDDILLESVGPSKKFVKRDEPMLTMEIFN